MKKLVGTVFVALVLTAGTWAQADGTMMKSDSGANGTMMKSDSMMKSDTTMMKSDSTMMKSDSMMVSEADQKMSADPMDITAYNLKGLGPQVVPFTTLKDAMMMGKANSTVVYFFAATWCPDCQATYKDLKAHFTTLPKDFLIVFVNYDKSKDLEKKYGITAQHTFLIVGPTGEKKKLWSGTTTVADIVKTALAM